MSDVIFPNFALQSANHAFSAVWKLTRSLKKAGYTYKASSDGSAKDTTGVATNDKWGGSADPASDTYPTGLDSVAAWWNAQGPTVLKVPMTSAATGTFVRGEKITQAVSLAEGELVGLDFDSVGLVGHAVVLPRTGTFNNTNVITGATSGATLTPSGTLENFVQEIVIWKTTNTTQGSIYLQRVSNETENASRFSVLAASAGCTATVAPGGGGTGNSFPSAGSYVGCGSNISGSPVHSAWVQASTNLGRAQIVTVNNIGSTGVSPDGSFWMLMGDVSSSTASQFFGYIRMDNSEDADLDPYVWFKVSGTLYSSVNVRLDATGTTSLTGGGLFTGAAPSSVAWRGWRRRGFSTNDGFIPLTTAVFNFGSGGGSVMATDNLANPETVACSYTTKRVREQFLVLSADNTKKIRKGVPRWITAIQGGTTYDTWDSKTKVCILINAAQSPTVVVGPYDGTSTPLQA